jgi:putative membrane protein
MDIFLNLLLWLHFTGVAMALGGGMALAVTGPQFMANVAEYPELMWSVETALSRVGSAGLLLLLITGPLMVWLRFGGTAAMNGWFWLKMGLVAVATFAVGTHHVTSARFRSGDESALGTMALSGRIAGFSLLAVVFCAVFAFS